MSWRMADFVCRTCAHEFEDLYRAGRPEEVVCLSCGSADVQEKLAAPMVMQVALADGMKRQDSMELAVRSQKMKTAAYRKPPTERTEFLRESIELGAAARQAQEKGK